MIKNVYHLQENVNILVFSEHADVTLSVTLRITMVFANVGADLWETRTPVVKEVRLSFDIIGNNGSNLFSYYIRFDKFLCIERSSECVMDSGCLGHQTCLDQTCKNLCQKTTCGRNAKCEANNHHATCKCPRGFFGDPYTFCKKSKTIFCYNRQLCH